MMARELNISLIIGIIVAILPIWQWDSGIELLISAFTIAGIAFGIILWLEDKKGKEKEPHSGNCKGSITKRCCMK